MNVNAETQTFAAARGHIWRNWSVTTDLNNRRVTTVATSVSRGRVRRQKTVRRFEDRDSLRRYADRHVTTKVRAGYVRLT